MKSIRFLSLACVAAGVFLSIRPVVAEPYEVIMRGTVVTQNGAPLPKTVGIERKCSDTAADAPGVITNSKGEYQWRMMVDPTNPFVCYLQATSNGYSSSHVDVTKLDGYTSKVVTLPPITLFLKDSDPTTINSTDSGVPNKAGSAWRAAMKALAANKRAETITQLEAAVAAAPFARGYHALGVVNEAQNHLDEAKKAYEQAIATDPKMVPPYVLLTKVCVKLKDWKCAASSAEATIQADTKHLFPQVYLHQATALYEMKNLAGAEAAAREGLKIDPNHALMPRLEYVLGRILDAKGDHDAAREQLNKYLSIDKDTPDADLIRARLTSLGQPDLWDGADLELI